MVPFIEEQELTVPMVVAAQMTQLAIALKACIDRFFSPLKDVPDATPPDAALPWIKLYMTALKYINDMSPEAQAAARDPTKVMAVIVDAYNVLKEKLPPEARIALARASQAKEATVTES